MRRVFLLNDCVFEELLTRPSLKRLYRSTSSRQVREVIASVLFRGSRNARTYLRSSSSADCSGRNTESGGIRCISIQRILGCQEGGKALSPVHYVETSTRSSFLSSSKFTGSRSDEINSYTKQKFPLPVDIPSIPRSYREAVKTKVPELTLK